MTTKESKSKKFVRKNCTLPYRILFHIVYGHAILPSQLTKYLKISKQRLDYWLKKLQEEHYVEKPYHGIYDITDLGKKVLRGFEKQQGKLLVRLENMRYKFPILKNYDYLINHYPWKKITKLKNIKIIHTKIWGFTIRIICSHINPSIEICCQQKLGYDIYEMMYEAKSEVQIIANIIQEKRKVVLGEPEPSMQPEWAIPSPLSEALLSASCSSQIRTPDAVFNRSKNRDADIEVRDPRYALQILEMPKTIRRIENKIAMIGYGTFPVLFL